jgi:hypothetical protein
MPKGALFMHEYHQRLLCPKCTRLAIEGTPFTQVKECSDCEKKRQRNESVRGMRFVSSVRSVGDALLDQGVSGNSGSTLRSVSGEGRDDRSLARQLQLKTLAKMPFLEWCRYQDPKTGQVCAKPIKRSSRIPKDKSESIFILGLSLRRCSEHTKQLSQEYMKNYLKLYLPKYMEQYPREKRLASLKASNAKRYHTPEHQAYMRAYLRSYRAFKRGKISQEEFDTARANLTRAEQVETTTVHDDHESAVRGA